jgi:hypothetical protein
MTREEFIEELSYTEYTYEIKGDKIVITGDEEGNFIMYLPSIPSDVIFSNPGYVELNYIENIPSGVEFNNGEFVALSSLETLPPGVVFNNSGGIYLRSIFGTYVDYWDGNIKNVNSKSLLNLMISKGLFV